MDLRYTQPIDSEWLTSHQEFALAKFGKAVLLRRPFISGFPRLQEWLALSEGAWYSPVMAQDRSDISAGARLRAALQAERPLQIVGAINAYSAILAGKCGFRALYLSGAGVANASYGLPDLGITSLADVLEDVRRITSVSNLPLLVDADTGWGAALGIQRTVREMIRAGAAALHIEDQVGAKRCGHRPGKQLVSSDEMCNRLKAASDAKTDPQFVIMARTDAAAAEGLSAAIARARVYCAAGAEMIFAEALTSLEDYRAFCSAVPAPVLANITEFGKTPLFTVRELAAAGVRIALFPLSAFRAMSASALSVFRAIRRDGTQRNVINQMQTREELYQFLNYAEHEAKLDELFHQEKQHADAASKSADGSANHTTARRAPRVKSAVRNTALVRGKPADKRRKT